MDDLIEALQIFRKYANEEWPTHCEHDVLMVVNISRNDLSEEDYVKVKKLGFIWSDDDDSFISYKFGSA